MVKAYILVSGPETEALNQVRSVPGVADLTLVFGGWDAVVHAEAKTLPAPSRLVVGQIRGSTVSRRRRRSPRPNSDRRIARGPPPTERVATRGKGRLGSTRAIQLGAEMCR